MNRQLGRGAALLGAVIGVLGVLGVLGVAGCGGATEPAAGAVDASVVDADLVAPDAVSPDAGPAWRSALYPTDWTPATTGIDAASGLFLHDFSYAGYKHGTTPPPIGAAMTEFPACDRGADPTGATDSTAAIQAAIDAAAVAGGVVTFPAGTFRVDGSLHVTFSNVVLRGAGSAATRLRFTAAPAGPEAAYITFAGASTVATEALLTDDGIARSNQVVVPATSAFHVGDDVIVGARITEAFIVEHEMNGVWDIGVAASRNLDRWKPFFRRTVTAVSTTGSFTTITVDVPLRYPLKLRDGASIQRVTGGIHDVGLEGLAVSDIPAAGRASDEPRIHVVEMAGVSDGWMHDIASFAPGGGAADPHVQSGGLLVYASKRVTIDHSAMQRAVNHGDGGAGYLFEVMQSSEVLIADSFAEYGRHDFIFNWDFGNSGHVLLRDHSAHATGVNDTPIGTTTSFTKSEFHHSLTMAVLVDSCDLADGFNAYNRGADSSGAGHAATESVFWNVRGGGQILSYQAGNGYVVGTTDIDVQTDLDWIFLFGRGDHTAPRDWAEGVDQGQSLEPQSLYQDQLARRLGATN